MWRSSLAFSQRGATKARILMSDSKADDLLKAAAGTRELSRLGINFSPATLRNHADAGRIPTVRTADGTRLFRRGDLEVFAKALRG
jgi:hypothetical protein